MPSETMANVGLHKRLTTKPSDEGIALILATLEAAPAPESTQRWLVR